MRLCGGCDLPRLMDSSQFMIRRRTPLALMLYGVYVYLCSNSLRRASSILEPVIGRSHEAIRQWVQRVAPICDGFDVDRRLVGAIFVDETMVKIRGREAWVWIAFEPGLRVLPRVPYLLQSEHPSPLRVRESRGSPKLRYFFTNSVVLQYDRVNHKPCVIPMRCPLHRVECRLVVLHVVRVASQGWFFDSIFRNSTTRPASPPAATQFEPLSQSCL